VSRVKGAHAVSMTAQSRQHPVGLGMRDTSVMGLCYIHARICCNGLALESLYGIAEIAVSA